MRALFGMGAIGETIQQIQQTLTQAGFDTKGSDGWYGQDTASAARAFQKAKSLPVTGTIDDGTWPSLMQRPTPAVSARSLQLTAAFENHGFGLAVGNFDGALLTWGIIGFTVGSGKVQAIVLAVNKLNGDIVRQAFGAHTDELLSLMAASGDFQKQWANEHTLANGSLAAPWRSMFATFGSFPEVQQEQLRLVQEQYMNPAIKTATQLGFTTELGLALCFDIHVQNGPIKPAAMKQINQKRAGDTTEAGLRKIVANAAADFSKAKWKEDVRRRKLTIAIGQGTVHGHSYLLENWGLAELDAAELTQAAVRAPT